MPEVSRFLGIVIGMFYREHGVAYFHAAYGQHEVSIEVETGTVHGDFPPRAQARIVGGLATGSAGPTPEADSAAGVVMQNYHILEARYVADHVVWLRFRDGTAGEIDLASELRGPIFELLRDPLVFRSFAIHPEFHTLVWPNGADFAPEFLHDNVPITA